MQDITLERKYTNSALHSLLSWLFNWIYLICFNFRILILFLWLTETLTEERAIVNAYSYILVCYKAFIKCLYTAHK